MQRDCSIEVGTETFSTADATWAIGLNQSRGRKEQSVTLSLVIAFSVIMRDELG
jgi:hypothetical protein